MNAPEVSQGRHVSRRAFLGTGLGVGLAGLLAAAGCGSSTKSSSGPTSGTGSQAASQPAGTATGPVTFTSWIVGLQKNQTLLGVLHDFETSSGIKVSPNALPYAQYLDQAVLKAKSGALTGVAHIDESWMSTLASAGLIKDLTGLVDESQYPDIVKTCGIYNGKRYGMPWTLSAIGMISNSAILKAANVDPSAIKTVDDFTQALRTLKKSDSQLVPYAPSTSVKLLKDIIPWMWAFGSTLVDGKTVTLGDAGSVAAVDYWKKLLDEGLIQGNLERIPARTLFAQGRAAIYDDASQAIGYIPAQSSDKSIASKMQPFARPAGQAPGKSLLWSQPLVTFTKQAGDVKLMQYLSTNVDALKTMFEGTDAQPPALTKAQQQPWFEGNAFYQSWTKVVMANAARDPFWNFPNAAGAETVLYEAVDSALNGKTSSASALRSAKDQLQGMLAG